MAHGSRGRATVATWKSGAQNFMSFATCHSSRRRLTGKCLTLVWLLEENLTFGEGSVMKSRRSVSDTDPRSSSPSAIY